ncbi:acyl-CoA synthetase (AMP-forming)/AMP-acid ligase II [Mumia flava]|uniref:Acyl-CoA synthetase (AMP-forming)/AMP-acid ligase II n=1 Tax=Mumia flava TaxID=1348852 RepID=A0A0B2BTD6_9ACTN|nr:class I adenylate-forming enzyme family protein [Mumia flava]PJJ57321.1 acyl-CoA synthetase (AMP-forming)/AMP-acid ligase II [Mumia flava]
MARGRGLHTPERVADYTGKGWWSDETTDALFAEQVRLRGDALAVVDPANRAALLGSEPRRLTWNELDAEVTHLAARLLDLGLGRGDVLGVQLPNTIELVEVYLAAWSLGVVVSPLPMQYRERELVGMANQAEFAVFVTTEGFAGRNPAADAAAARDRIPSLRAVVALGLPGEEADATPADVVRLVPSAASAADTDAVAGRRAEDPNDPNDCLTICWTSGTESEPKGVPRCHYDWLAIAWATVDAPRVTSDDVLLNPFPMVNMAGINGMFLPWLRTGAVLVQHHPFDLPTFFAQIAVERVTYTVAPPALLWMLLHDEDLLAKVDLSSLTRIGSGSVPLQPSMVKGWQDRGIPVINFFGSNEGIGLLSSAEDFPDPVERAQFFPRYGAPGVTWSSRVSEWMSTKLVDVLTGEEITDPGRSGELHIAGPTVFAGYLHPELRPSPFDDEGYLKTGDLFEIAGDDGQFLHYLDRAKDLVIRGGMNIAPAELEGLIGAHAAVADVAVIGDPDEVLGERVAAVVTLKPDASLTLDELLAFLKEQKIASFKLPERLEVREELPRNPVGKILKRELRRESVTERA